VFKEKINIVWFKRDLRLVDQEPLYYAQQANLPTLLIYLFEPSVMAYADSDVRHWRFVYESIKELNEKLKAYHTQIHIFQEEAGVVFEKLVSFYTIDTVYSYEETGNQLTYARDEAMAVFFKKNNIKWLEQQQNGVFRGLKSKKDWSERWENKMRSDSKTADLNLLPFTKLPIEWYEQHKGANLTENITKHNPNFQQGGEHWAWRYLQNFIEERYINYSKHISSPLLSRKSCSRLSPYISYGNISMRMVYQYTMLNYDRSKNKRALANFVSRLHWHCHFIQKFESNCNIEFQNINGAYDALVKPKNDVFILAWQTGKTGVPIVDACMRCLVETGYLNFRMRAMVVSFFCFNLWQDWRELHFLARQFLDYEPGIHYPQLQMQSGTTVHNTIRIYNAVKNSEAYDYDGLFIKKWLPELRNIPAQFIHEPHKLSLIEQQLYQCELGKDYPYPIVDIEATRKEASDIVWSFRKPQHSNN
jgi:deoxyribodipyrimidine photo-lyase